MAYNANATYYQDPTATTAREAEVTAADFSGGMNKGGSNAPGVGINIAGGALPAAGTPGDDQWTLLDQHEAVRVPQDGQELGGAGFVDRSSVAWISSGGVEGAGSVPINVTDNDTEVNDTTSLATLAAGWIQNTVA